MSVLLVQERVNERRGEEMVGAEMGQEKECWW